MRYIRNISDDQNKSGDTDNIFRFNLLQGDDVFNFGDYPISINIANSSGYILSMVPEKEFGNSVVKLDFNDQSLKSLTPDNYLLEVEVKFPDGTTATFPTKGGMPFTVNSNLKNTAGQLVPTVTFDEVLNAVDKKVKNYLATVVKGDKGDTGVVDTTADYTWAGTNTFNKKIIAPAGVQGNADTATKLQTARRINGTLFDGTSDINVNAANDSNLVHRTGDEIVDGSKTFTQLINGYTNTNVTQNTDLNLIKKSGKYGIADPTSYKNLPTNSNSSYKMLIVEDVLGAGVFYQTLYERRAGFSTADVYFRSFYAGNWLPWTKTSHDDEVLHLTGTETVAGDKTFTGTTTLNNVVSSNVKNASITALGFTVSFAETALGVNVNVLGSGISLLADNTWHILGNMPANITKPKINMYSSMTFAAPAGSASTNTGFTLRLSLNTTGEIDYKIISLREGDKANYTVTFDSFISSNWIK
ncbi:pyocin knob domain-containing protein [Leuconostoc lactis]|uniref:pyocin knob domain-containing protein n=1 Tax=Leuconostoc lactis TaxID=1246 RepID=UPI00351F51CB